MIIILLEVDKRLRKGEKRGEDGLSRAIETCTKTEIPKFLKKLRQFFSGNQIEIISLFPQK